MSHHTTPKFQFIFRLLSSLSILLSLGQSLSSEERPKKKQKMSININQKSEEFKKNRYHAFCGEFNDLNEIKNSNNIRIGAEVELRRLNPEDKEKVVNFFHQQKNMNGQLTKADITNALFYRIENIHLEEPHCEDHEVIPEKLKKNKLFKTIRYYSDKFLKNNLTIHDLNQIINSDEKEHKINNSVSIYNKDNSFEESVAIHFDDIFPEFTTPNRKYVLSISNGIDHVRRIYENLGLDLSPHEKAHLIDANDDYHRMTSLHLHFSFSPKYQNLLNKSTSSDIPNKKSSRAPESDIKIAMIAQEINALQSISILYNSCISNNGKLLTKPIIAWEAMGRFNIDPSSKGVIRSPIYMEKDEVEDTDTYPQVYKFDSPIRLDGHNIIEDPYRIEVRRFVGSYEDDLTILGCMTHELMKEGDYEKTKKKILNFVDEIIESLQKDYSSCLEGIETPFLKFKKYVRGLKD